MNLLKKYRKFVFFGGIGALVIFIIACSTNSDSKNLEEKKYIPQVETAIVTHGLSREIATTGEVRAAKSVTLTNEARADVQNVFVRVGDSVRAGQLLVQLSSASVSSTRSTASAAYVNAQNSVTQTQLSAEKSIEAAQVALNTAEISLANTLAQNKTLLRQAEETLNAAKLSSGLSVSAAQTTLENAIRAAYPTAQNAISASDEIIGVSSINRNANDSYEYFLGALKSSSKSLAENMIKIALNQLSLPVNNFDSATALLQSSENAILKTLDVLNNSTTGTTFTQTTLDTEIATITSQLSAIRTVISTLNSAKSALESAEQNSNGTSQSIISAEANYSATLAQLDANEKSARQTVESAKAAFESAQKSADLSQTSVRASLNSAAGSLNQAQISQNKLRITAPFSGKITAVEIEPGDEVPAGATLITVEDASNLKIIAHLSTNEIRKIKIGDEVKIATKSSDKITAISPSADPITKKYEVEIYHQNPFLQSGEFVKLRFQIGDTHLTDERIFLPLTAINILASGNFVWVVEDSKIVKRIVVLGDLEGEFVEILSGVEVDEEVIVKGGRIFAEDDEGVEIEILN